ncbi:MAG: MaoC family dehydratase [Rhodobacter sp.]|nr:MaoC family dehydratase [Rhodobacter sp.]
MTRLLPPGRHGVDAVTPGDRIETKRHAVTAADIDAFAALSGDRFEIHMSDAAAQSHGFPGRVAHGLLVLSLIDGLKNQAPAQFDAIASLSWDWSFRGPVFIGDVIGATITVAAKRAVTKPDRGILTLAFDVTNQSGETVQQGTNQVLAYR